MNSKFNKTFYTCLTESPLFLDLWLRSFLRCSVHIFLGHDSYFKNQFKNFVEPYHEELSRQQDSLLLTGPAI